MPSDFSAPVASLMSLRRQLLCQGRKVTGKGRKEGEEKPLWALMRAYRVDRAGERHAWSGLVTARRSGREERTAAEVKKVPTGLQLLQDVQEGAAGRG